MKTSRNRNTRNRSLSQSFQATFGRIETPQAGRKSLIALGTVCLLITGAASADWRVYDSRVEGVLEEIEKKIGGSEDNSVNKNLDEMNDRLAIKGDELTIGDKNNKDNPILVEPKESADKLPSDKARPTAILGVGIDARCPKPGEIKDLKDVNLGNVAGSLLGKLVDGPLDEQHKVCEEMYNTEIAKYRFSLEMHDLAKKRNEKLQAIIKERNDLGEKEFGKMEENTNKLVALTAQMDNDRDRYQTYLHAYDARTAYLQKAHDLLSKQAINGGGSSKNGWLASLLPAAVGAAGLAMAFDSIHTGKNDCTEEMRTAGACDDPR